MKDSNNLRFALRTAVLVEKQSFDFYKYAEKMVNSSKTKEVFRILASEEAEHLGVFHRLYQEYKFGSLNDLIKLPTNLDTPNYRALRESVKTNTQEKEALFISLREEQSCVKLYSDLSRSFKDCDVCNVFDQGLRETSIHCSIIYTEYMCVLSLEGTSDDVLKPHNLKIINLEKGDFRQIAGKNPLLLTGPSSKVDVQM